MLDRFPISIDTTLSHDRTMQDFVEDNIDPVAITIEQFDPSCPLCNAVAPGNRRRPGTEHTPQQLRILFRPPQHRPLDPRRYPSASGDLPVIIVRLCSGRMCRKCAYHTLNIPPITLRMTIANMDMTMLLSISLRSFLYHPSACRLTMTMH